MKSEALAKLLPAAQPGWTREAAAEEEAGAGGFMGMLGGGTSAAATYRKGAESFTITLVADSPMVSGLGAMISGMAGHRPAASRCASSAPSSPRRTARCRGWWTAR